MKKFICFLALILILAACGTTNEDLDDKSYSVYPHEAEAEADDFVYRLTTEKDVYDEFSDTAIFAELTYVGEKESIDIYHAASPFYFYLEERTRDYDIDYAMEDPLLTTTLKKGEPLREKYTFAGGYSDTDNKAYIEFIETIVNEGFPEGNYIINGSAQFSTSEPGETIDEATLNMNVNIGFTVTKGVNE